MLVRDPFSGFLHEVPDYGGHGFSEPPLEETPDLSEYDIGEVVYDGLGQPLGLFPLIPLIASALPAIAGAAKAVIPTIASAIPKVASVVSSLVPSGGGGPAPPMPFAPAAPMPFAPAPRHAPPGEFGPGPGPSTVVAPRGPNQLVTVRRFRRRRPHVG